jgi:hypothetical protein
MLIWNITLFDRLLVSVTEEVTAKDLVRLLNSGKLHGVPGDPAAYTDARAARAAGGVASVHAVNEAVAGLIHKNVPEAIEVVDATDTVETLDAMHAAERKNPRWKKERREVLDAIEERKGEVTTKDANVGDAEVDE